MKVVEILSGYRPTVRYLGDDVPQDIVDLIIKAVDKVPTQFSLHPTNYWIVSSVDERKKLFNAFLKQPQVLDAPTIILFSASRFTAKRRARAMESALVNETITPSQAETLEQQMKIYFDVSPLGFGWFGKLFAAPLIRLFTAFPQLACIHKREWITRQVMRPATLFWYTAQESDYSAEFIDSFDEWRVKKALGIPWHHVVVACIAFGYTKTRQPKVEEVENEDIDSRIHR